MSLIIQAIFEGLAQVSKLVDLARDPKIKSLDQAAIELEIAKIKNWAKESSEADWDIVKQGGKP